MASVTSLDADMRNLRMSRYTPRAANEARAWVESTLDERLPSGDLLEALKDGVALCKLANRAIQPQAGAIRFKASPMPFIQMENISHFLRACELPPLSLPAHDRFLTVDLFEAKDPAQVLQCLGAFSRRANKLDPGKFPTVIGPKKAAAAMSPANTGYGSSARPPSYSGVPTGTTASAARALSPTITGGSNNSQPSNTKSPSGPTSSWSSKADQYSTAPAWNIHQYGYMGGASQGNQGISFGARRQITSQAPSVPSLAEKEKLRREKEEAEADRLRQEQQEQERRHQAERAEEERTQAEEERRWEEETRRVREEEKRRVEQQKREWEEQERKWKEDEEARRKEDAVLQATIAKRPPEKLRVPSSGVLRGQTLAEYQREQTAASRQDGSAETVDTPEQRRVKELEKQLEEARERERQYQTEREERMRKGNERSRPSTAQTETTPSSVQDSEAGWAGDERDFFHQQWRKAGNEEPAAPPTQIESQRPLPSAPKLPSRMAPEETYRVDDGPPPALSTRQQPGATTALTPRPLPPPEADPEVHRPKERESNRTDRFLNTNAAPVNTPPRVSASQEAGDTALEQSRLRDARLASQQKTKSAGWASKSLLEREMERERERQREWESNQAAVKHAPRDATQGVGEGQTWDVNQYGYVGGDSMNKGSSVGSGINIGGRRQIIGPRPKP